MGNWSDYILKLFQSTLPRRERRIYKTIQRIYKGISIHTPTKGATRIPYKTCDHLYNFNPHSHEGSDRGKDNPCYGCTISIHTPTKGATGSLLPYQNGINNFNPHSHEGSDIADKLEAVPA